jgi:hypothetical protein
MEEALSRIHRGLASGAQITTCVYPYDYWATYLHSRRFGPGWRERYGLDYEDLYVVGAGEKLTAETFEEYRAVPGVLVAVPEGTIPPQAIDLALKEDFCLVGSDGGILKSSGIGHHPRGAGCFSTAIRRGLTLGLSMEQILGKMTALPRALVGEPLQDRGAIIDGSTADITVLDPATIDGQATLENPARMSKGIEAVIVNGKLAFYQGRVVEKAGMPVRATQQKTQKMFGGPL